MRTLIISYKRSLALFLAIVLCLSVPQMSALAESNPSTEGVENEETKQENGSNATVTVEVTEGEEDKEPEIKVTVDHPMADPTESEKTEWEGTGSNNNITVEVKDGQETSSAPDPDETTYDSKNRPVSESGTTEGSQTVIVTVDEGSGLKLEDIKPENAADLKDDDGNTIGFQYEENGIITVVTPQYTEGILTGYTVTKTTTDIPTGGNVNVNLKDVDFTKGPQTGSGTIEVVVDELVKEIKPTPEGCPAPEVSKVDNDDNHYNWKDSDDVVWDWKTEEYEKEGKKGWKTTETSIKTESGPCDATLPTEIPGVLDYDRDSDENVIGYTWVTEEEGDDGVKTTVVVTVRLNDGEYEKVTTTTKVSRRYVEKTEAGELKVTVSGVNTGTANGELTGEDKLQSLGPTQGVLDSAQAGSDSSSKNTDGNTWAEDHLFRGTADGAHKEAGEDLALTDMEIQSTVFIEGIDSNGSGAYSMGNKDKNGNNATDWPSVWMRKISDSYGNVMYVYCAEKGVPDIKGNLYELGNVEDGNSNYHSENIQYVVENGWWGTANGQGSLERVRAFLNEWLADKDYSGKEYYAGAIDNGLAMAVTQAAIWYHSNPELDCWKNLNADSRLFKYCLVRGKEYEKGKLDSLSNNPKKPEQEAAMALFWALVEGGEVLETTDIIQKEDITNTSITVVRKLDSSSLSDITKAVQELQFEQDSGHSGQDFYETQVSLTLAVAPSRIDKDDLLVLVCVGDDIIASQRVTRDELEANDGAITINDVILQEGATINLRLEGVQKLNTGAYLFQSDVDLNAQKSQTMVGYVSAANAERKVDLNVTMTFDVTKDAQATVTTTTTQTMGSVETRNESWSGTWERTYTYQDGDDDDDDTPTPTPTPGGGDDDDDDTPTPPGGDDDDDTPVIPDEPTPLGDEPGIEIPDEPTPLGEAPEIEITDDPVPLAEAPMAVTLSDTMLVELPEDPVPLADVPVLVELPDEDVPLADLVDLFDEDVPLADVPETGDISTLWYVLILTAGGCLLAMSIADERKKRHQALAN